MPPQVACTLAKWHKHAEREVARGGHVWTRTAEGAWLGPDAEIREVVAGTGGETDDDEEGDSSGQEEDDECCGDGGGGGGGEQGVGEEQGAVLGDFGAGQKRKPACPSMGGDEVGAEAGAEAGQARKRPCVALSS